MIDVERLRQALQEIAEIADQRADVSDDKPNAWMTVYCLATDALNRSRPA